MPEAPTDRRDAAATDLFSAEELEMMGGADAVFDSAAAQQDAAALQQQYKELAVMVAEGAERERQLRALVNELTLIAQQAGQQRAYAEQTQNLARLVLASSERELHLQHCLDAVRTIALARARTII